ncbi:MAG: RdgB/HAM1 family non-canonical purine NTP pyrophosphatase [Candidatus Aminicenantes bacterium]|nr:RdgB/HAM1 family non-canonical purine NTP pyrophosphatase [Candidatus Aminicenantes bacterium]
MKKKFLLATTNQGKIKEIKDYLADLPLEIVSLQQLSPKPIFIEKGKTFQENARGKSLYYSQQHSLLTLTEDSGLEIEYLGGAPGVFSSRFSGPRATDEKNIRKVLKLMKGVPPDKRKAQFVSCLALTTEGKTIKEIKESVKGIITLEKKGNYGFGYDPIFFYPPLKKTFAELLPAEKNRVSHRGRALKKLKEFLLLYLESEKKT